MYKIMNCHVVKYWLLHRCGEMERSNKNSDNSQRWLLNDHYTWLVMCYQCRDLAKMTEPGLYFLCICSQNSYKIKHTVWFNNSYLLANVFSSLFCFVSKISSLCLLLLLHVLFPDFVFPFVMVLILYLFFLCHLFSFSYVWYAFYGIVFYVLRNLRLTGISYNVIH